MLNTHNTSLSRLHACGWRFYPYIPSHLQVCLILYHRCRRCSYMKSQLCVGCFSHSVWRFFFLPFFIWCGGQWNLAARCSKIPVERLNPLTQIKPAEFKCITWAIITVQSFKRWEAFFFWSNGGLIGLLCTTQQRVAFLFPCPFLPRYGQDSIPCSLG